jgi:hypothetical protein
MVIITSLFQALGFLGRQQKYLQALLYGLRGYLATITAADEAKISGEQAEGAGWIGGSDAELKEFGNGLQVLKGLRMVEQEQLSGMDLLLVQQHLLIICLVVGRAKSVQWSQEDCSHESACCWNSKFLE